MSITASDNRSSLDFEPKAEAVVTGTIGELEKKNKNQKGEILEEAGAPLSGPSSRGGLPPPSRLAGLEVELGSTPTPREESFADTLAKIQKTEPVISVGAALLLEFKVVSGQIWSIEREIIELQTQLTVNSLETQAKVMKKAAVDQVIATSIGLGVSGGMQTKALVGMRNSRPELAEMKVADHEVKTIRAKMRAEGATSPTNNQAAPPAERPTTVNDDAAIPANSQTGQPEAASADATTRANAGELATDDQVVPQAGQPEAASTDTATRANAGEQAGQPEAASADTATRANAGEPTTGDEAVLQDGQPGAASTGAATTADADGPPADGQPTPQADQPNAGASTVVENQESQVNIRMQLADASKRLDSAHQLLQTLNNKTMTLNSFSQTLSGVPNAIGSHMSSKAQATGKGLEAHAERARANRQKAEKLADAATQFIGEAQQTASQIMSDDRDILRRTIFA